MVVFDDLSLSFFVLFVSCLLSDNSSYSERGMRIDLCIYSLDMDIWSMVSLDDTWP